jgi:ABC-type transport system involved in cytochrome bd biosynthesis fused ATPase/permease subunit
MLKFFVENIIDDILDLDEVLLSVLFCVLFFGLWILNGIILYSFGFSLDLSTMLGLFITIMIFLLIPICKYLNGIYKRYQVEESKNYAKEIERNVKKR